MSSVAGINRIDFCDKGSLSGTPTNGLSVGLRSTTDFEQGSHSTIKTYLESELRNQQNFKAEAESFQATMQMIQRLIIWSGVNFDAQIITTPQNYTAGSENVFKMIDEFFFGMDFEYEISSQKDAAKITIERALDHEKAIVFLDSADSETAVTVPGVKGKRGFNFDFYTPPSFLGFKVNNTDFVSLENLVDWKLKIKSSSTKSKLTNVSKVHNLSSELEVVTDEASIESVVNQLRGSMAPEILVKSRTKGNLFKGFHFCEDSLVSTDKFSIKDKERTRTITYKGEIPKYEFLAHFGSSFGGAADDKKGTTGGTLKVGF